MPARRNATVGWCPPIHQAPAGPTDPTGTTLHSPFVAVVIGSSRGIGRSTALAYARAGASGVVVTGRSNDSLSSAVADVRAAAAHPDPSVLGIQCDVCSEADVRALAHQVHESFGQIDALVINAGVASSLAKRPDGSMHWVEEFGAVDLADLRRSFDVNFFAVIAALKYLLPLVEAAGTRTEHGDEWRSPQAVLVVTSAAAHVSTPKGMGMGYSLSKYAETRLVEFVHEGHKEKGISAYAIQPGGVLTEMAKNDLPKHMEWEKVLTDDPMLCGGLCVWLSKERREWLSGRYIDARWDVEELERRKGDIIEKDLLKFRMTM